MAIARLARQAKRPHGVCIKTMAVTILGLCFIFFWSMFSSPSSSVTVQRESFDDIAEPVPASTKVRGSGSQSNRKDEQKELDPGKQEKKAETLSGSKEKEEKKVNTSSSSSFGAHKPGNQRQRHMSTRKRGKDKPKSTSLVLKEKQQNLQEGSDSEDPEKETEDEEEVQVVVDGKEEALDGEGETNGDTEGEDDIYSVEPVDQEPQENGEEKNEGSKSGGRKRKMKGPVFDPKAHYSWRSCTARSKHNYIPCIDTESLIGRLKGHRHSERSCPRAPTMCLIPLPHDGYDSPVHWPESKLKILYKNVAHPKLAEYIKKHRWLVASGEYLTFPQNQTEFKGGVAHYLESIEEMVPDIEWGKNIRVVLDIGCGDSSFVASLLDKQVLTLSLGLKDDLVDLAQVSLERGFPTIVGPFSSRRLPFPSGVFDAIHCSECSIPWHSVGGKLLLEMNRILRPGGYFILSTKLDSVEEEEAMTKMTASICWNVLAHKADEITEVGVKIYQKPESNDIYELRRKKSPPICKENENPDAAWYVRMKACLHLIPSAIEQHGSEWPEEWPKRLEAYPEWLGDKEKAIAELKHWKAVVEKSYLTGMGIDWSTIRNVMDMKAIYGGFAAALAEQKIWVMNVVPVHAPDTLPFIYERGLVGVYHDWCESFGTYPRSYDLLHADHLFSRLKNRCKQPVSIVVEMDRVLRPGGWAIVRDKAEILIPLEGILKSLHWEIRMTYYQDREGIIGAQKTTWRP